ECDDPLPLLRRGVEARPTQRLGYLGLLPDELGRDGVLDDEDPSPAIGKAGGRRSGERRLPGAEELSAWPIERVDGKLEALRDGPEIRLAGKGAPHHPAAVGQGIADHGNLRNRPLPMAAAQRRAGDADQHQRGGRGRCPASFPEESAPSRSWRSDPLDAPAQAGRSSARGLLGERPGEFLLQGQLAPAARATAKVCLDSAPLIGGQLAVGECGNQLLEPRMFEGSLSHDHVPTPRLALFSSLNVSSPASNARPRLMRLMTVPIGTDVTCAISRYFKPCPS